MTHKPFSQYLSHLNRSSFESVFEQADKIPISTTPTPDSVSVALSQWNWTGVDFFAGCVWSSTMPSCESLKMLTVNKKEVIFVKHFYKKIEYTTCKISWI